MNTIKMLILKYKLYDGIFVLTFITSGKSLIMNYGTTCIKENNKTGLYIDITLLYSPFLKE